MILNRLIPAKGNRIQYLAWGIVLLTLTHLCWLQSRSESETQRLCAFAMQSPASRAALTPYEQLDRIAEQTGNDNVLLELAGYAKTNPAVQDSLSFIYYRTSYALYPRRMYVAPADRVINRGRDIMQTGFSPTPQWLHEHNVGFVLMFGNDDPNGEPLRLAPLPVRENESQTSTQKAGGNP